MPQRILTAVVGVPLLLVVIWAGLPWLTIVIGVVALLALREFYGLTAGARVSFPLGASWTVLFIVSPQLSHQPYLYWAPIAGGGVLATGLWLIAHRGEGEMAKRGLYMVAGPLYTGLLLSHALMLRQIGEESEVGRDWLLLAVFATFATDTGAFLAGRVLGRHAMSATVSPGKTWEGAAGGFISAIGVTLGLGAFLGLSPSLLQQAILGVAIGVMAQMGDLTESRLKRAAGVKDAGSILPGHGGLLDRLDSVFFTLPLAYYFAVIVE